MGQLFCEKPTTLLTDKKEKPEVGDPLHLTPFNANHTLDRTLKNERGKGADARKRIAYEGGAVRSNA